VCKNINREIKVNNLPKINIKAKAVLRLISGLSLVDLLKLLSQIIDQVLRKLEADALCNKKPVLSVKTNFIPRQRGRKSIIESDLELKAIIDGETGYKTYEELRKICVDILGEERVPHKNTIARYVLKETKRRNRNESSYK